MRVRLTPDLVANVLGVLGLVCVVVAIGGLTGTWWWSLGAAGLVLVGLSYSVHTHAQVPTAVVAHGGPVRAVKDAA
ncbi:hypothetical protein [Planobispora longispora]|uniref:Uncharacterized protein n=1 Tax=Planobispora longispora TaxID=28887 RepID=A0A8J3RJJ6_9ACTN|nr:hypothetical protein [Planobispora longispora]BFE85817.1 hypothetical protein GCM10020093_084180 [Planobispora longispora]GIH76148.1 hypothetical protein Plo01_25770 [Planobispora longispora]